MLKGGNIDISSGPGAEPENCELCGYLEIANEDNSFSDGVGTVQKIDEFYFCSKFAWVIEGEIEEDCKGKKIF